MAANAKMLTSALYKSATTLQNCDFVLLSKHIAYKSQIFGDFLSIY